MLKAICKLNPPVYASTSITSPAKYNPLIILYSIVVEFISFILIPPAVTIASSTGLNFFIISLKCFNIFGKANISSIIEAFEYAESHNLGVVKELVGHGVGSNLHEMPDVPNYGKANTGPLLKEGMVIAVEPMLNLGTSNIYILDDDWTIITADNKPSAHFEHTVLVTKDGFEILTKR